VTFTDSAGRAWDIYDFRVVNRRRRKVPLGDYRAEARGFVPVDGGEVMIFRFGIIAYRNTTDRILGQQLAAAKPLSALRDTSLNDRPTTGAQP
jgi:hypothetical protein